MTQPKPLTLPDIRKKYPQYNDWSDTELATALHQRYYSDMPRENFDRQINAPLPVDWSQPTEAVREAITALPEEDRPRAFNQWAQHRVRGARERGGITTLERAGEAAASLTPVGAVRDLYRTFIRPEPNIPTNAIEDFRRNALRGTIVGPWADEAIAGGRAGVHALTGGQYGAPYDESVAVERASNRAIDAETPAALNIAAQIGGGLAGGGVAFRAARAMGLPQLFGQSLGRNIVAGVPTGAAHAYNYAAGNADETDLAGRHAAGVEAMPLGALLGGTVPVGLHGFIRGYDIAHNFASPTVARASTALRNKLGISASAAEGGGPAPPSTGMTPGEAAARQMAANTLYREGTTVDDVAEALARSQRNVEFGHPSVAPNRTVLADVSQAWQRMLSSMGRQSPESAKLGLTALEARQTGFTPGGVRRLDPSSNIPTRPPSARPITGAQAKKLYGTDFGVPADVPVAMGQREVASEGLRRSLRIQDAPHHGHLPSAYESKLKIVADAGAMSDTRYTALRKLAESKGYNPAPKLQEVVNDAERRIAQTGANQLGDEEVSALRLGISKLYRDGKLVTSIDALDDAQRAIRGQIQLPSTTNNVRRVLGDFRRKVLDKIDKAKDDGGVGAAFREARRTHSSGAREAEAFDFGYKGPKDPDEFMAGYNAMRTREMKEASLRPKAERDVARKRAEEVQKAARLGLWRRYHDQMGALKPTDDVTNIFKSRDYELLGRVIPRTETETGRVKMIAGQPAEYSDRPERLAQMMLDLRAQAQTAKKTYGGSPTAERTADDVHNEFLASLVDVAKSGGSGMLGKLTKGAKLMLDKMFGVKADTAAAAAKMMFTADPAAQQRTLNDLRMRMGRKRYELFTDYMRQYQNSIIGTGAGQVSAP